MEFETYLLQAGRNYAPAFQHQLGFSPHDCRGYGEQRSRRGQAVGNSPCISQFAHEIPIGQRIGCGDVHRAFDVVAVNEKFYGASEVGFVNPRDELTAIALSASETHADKI